MFERFTDRARKVMQLANQAAQKLNHEYIGTEHILLGLCQERVNVAARILEFCGVQLYQVEAEIDKIVQKGPDTLTLGKLPQTARAKKVIEFSIEEARNLGHNYVGTEHLLLGLLREGEGIAAQVLVNLGVPLDKARSHLQTVQKTDQDVRSEEGGTPEQFAQWLVRTSGSPFHKELADVLLHESNKLITSAKSFEGKIVINEKDWLQWTETIQKVNTILKGKKPSEKTPDADNSQ